MSTVLRRFRDGIGGLPNLWIYILCGKVVYLLLYQLIDVLWTRDLTRGQNALRPLGTYGLIFSFASPFALVALQIAVIGAFGISLRRSLLATGITAHNVRGGAEDFEFDLSLRELSLIAIVFVSDLVLTIGPDFFIGFGPINLIWHTGVSIAGTAACLAGLIQILPFSLVPARKKEALELQIGAADRLQKLYYRILVVLTGVFTTSVSIFAGMMKSWGEQDQGAVKEFVTTGTIMLPSAVTIVSIKLFWAYIYIVYALGFCILLTLMRYRQTLEVRLVYAAEVMAYNSAAPADQKASLPGR